MLKHRDSHSVKEFKLAPGAVVCGVIKMNMGCRIKLLDGHTPLEISKGTRHKSGKVQGRISVLEAGTGTHAVVIAELQRMERAGETLTQESVAKAAENLGYDGKPTYIFETNNLMVEGNIPKDLMAKVEEGRKRAREEDEDDDDDDDDDGGGGARPAASSSSSSAPKRQKKEQADPRVEFFKVVYPSYWKPPFQRFCWTKLTKLDWQYKMVIGLTCGNIAKAHREKFCYAGYRVDDVYRVENPTLWADYYLLRERIRQAHKSIAPVPNVRTKCTDSGANEYYLFHGLNESLTDVVLREGLDERVSNLAGMFGCGIYFAEESSKSDQYSHTAKCAQVGAVYKGGAPIQCTCDPNGTRCLLLCRVTLGTPLVRVTATSKEEPMRRPPVNPKAGVPYNSVLGESVHHDPAAALQFREYVVFDRRQVYPEFIVKYKRAAEGDATPAKVTIVEPS